VVEALAALNNPQTTPALINALTSDREEVRARAAYGLGLLRYEAATDLLAERLRADQPMVARRAGEALANIGSPAAMTAPLADSEMTAARHAAMAGLEQAGPQATHALVEALDAQNPAQRSHAAEMLGWVRDPKAVDALANALKDQEPGGRAQAAWALGEIGTTDARLALAAAQRGAVDEATKTALASAEQRARLNTAADRPAPAFSDGFVAALSNVPATSWTFFALSLALALALLLVLPRSAEPVRRR
jgi:HEAT repeat protein